MDQNLITIKTRIHSYFNSIVYLNVYIFSFFFVSLWKSSFDSICCLYLPFIFGFSRFYPRQYHIIHPLKEASSYFRPFAFFFSNTSVDVGTLHPREYSDTCITAVNTKFVCLSVCVDFFRGFYGWLDIYLVCLFLFVITFTFISPFYISYFLKYSTVMISLYIYIICKRRRYFLNCWVSNNYVLYLFCVV